MLSLPMWFSSVSGVTSNPAPYATVAIAGHTLAGGWCECGAPGCLCDPGEEMTYHGAQQAPDASKGTLEVKPSRSSEFDFGSGAILIALALFVWSRMRA